ncbi:NAD(P)-binding protein [Exidia glandulosa HHB12029]|uniref:NAD(P)-binding protein n=1 Tax=Exidia glandulosa HHB12029 TaxID=1314781 RepID=A0A165LI90_EXIGL|nr:NAD(P)-binding protein [Exidia glandulosa HHB12029]
MSFRSFAVAGAGGMGGEIVRALLGTGASVLVLSRSPSPDVTANAQSTASAMEALARSGRPAGDLDHAAAVDVKRALVDYTDEDALAQLLQDERIEVIISALRGGGFLAQDALARAGKRAGVQLFVPSEYGVPTIGRTTGTSVAIHLKTRIHQDTLKTLQLPFCIFFNGLWMEYWALILGLPNETNTAIVVGDGEMPVSTTARPDVAKFMAHVLTTLPKDQLLNRVFRIEGDRRTVNEVVSVLSKLTGIDIQKRHLDVESTKATALLPQNDPAQYVQWLAAEFAQGTGTVSFDAVTGRRDLPTDNALWPQWNPVRLEEGLPKKL